LHLVSPAKVARMNAALRGRARKPGFLVLMSGAAVEKYQQSADLIAVDWYPVPWAPVATVAREMRLARLGMRDRPFFSILQAFDWSSFSGLLRTDVPLRAPTADEMRCMAYLSLMQGASGIFFYTYHTEKWKLSEHPSLWTDLSRLAGEIRTNAPIFEERVDWWPVQAETHGAPDEMYNEIMEARVVMTLFRVRKGLRDITPGYYLVAANTSGEPADFSFDLPFARVDHFEAGRAREPFVIQEHTVRKSYAPFEVSIFGPIQGELAE
jgi:hypothetical protein